MFKKIVLFSLIGSVVACTEKPTQQEAPFPGEFANADYILSDQNAKQWVIQSEQMAQCIYPNLTKIQREHFSKEDAYIHSQYVFFYPLEKVIGEQYVKIIQDDEKSMGYAQYQFKRFKNNVEVKPLDLTTCQILQKQAKDDLAVVKGQYKSGMAEETPQNENTEGVATGQNKFFFDIIKWGTTLLL